jgi:low affinity Fe/Cu permease
MGTRFAAFARHASAAVGSAWAFIIAFATIVAWAISGPIFGFSDTWQLVINTATTIVTFLMVFLIQNTQNRDAHAIHLKLDELIHASKGARDQLIDLEQCTDEEIEALQRQFERVRQKDSRRRGGHLRGGPRH